VICFVFQLVITSRGIHALTSLSPALAEKVMQVTTRVEGRTLHLADGTCVYQPYGPDSSFCNFSVSRWELNCVLMSAAEEAGCVFHFSHPLAHLDVANATAYFYLANKHQLYQKAVKATHFVGADGGGSRARQSLVGHLNARDECAPLGYGYVNIMYLYSTLTTSFIIWGTILN
jgi:2-polyprenyl-6-methoxyphenol hydroxylase-like FAD-dependent oxidoreductase